MHRPHTWILLAASLGLGCDAAGEPDEIAELDSETGATSDDGDDDEPVPAGPDGLFDEPEPDAIIEGWEYDSDRDVLVSSYFTPDCSGTLLRNDVVLTAKHCVEDGQGNLVPGNSFNVTQDGPYGLGAIALSAELAVLATEDVALLRLQTPMTIDGRTEGESTQIFSGSHDALLGEVTLCQGWGIAACDEASAGIPVLRAGLMRLAEENAGMLTYEPLEAYGQIQALGDSGSSCRLPVFEEPRFRKVLGVLSTGQCAVRANEVSPERYRDFAISTMNAWAGNFTDGFDAPGNYEVDGPSNLLQGPAQWTTTGGKLTENSNAYGVNGIHEGSRYVHEAEVFSDGWISVRARSLDNDGAGLLLRYRDSTHYYRLSFDEQRRFARIVRRNGNAWQVLAEDLDFDIDWSSNPELTFASVDNFLVGMVDGVWVLAVFDPASTYTAGRAGIYQWGLTNASFDDLEIVRF